MALIHPHQRCGYSDLPFARIHDFYTSGSRKGLEGVDTGVHRLENHKIVAPIHPLPFCSDQPNPKIKKGIYIYIYILETSRRPPGVFRFLKKILIMLKCISSRAHVHKPNCLWTHAKDLHFRFFGFGFRFGFCSAPMAGIYTLGFRVRVYGLG